MIRVPLAPLSLALLLLTLPLAACETEVPVRYVGSLVRRSGSCTDSSATLVRRGAAISFAPSDGALVLPGTVAPNGQLQASLTGPGLNGVPFAMLLDGTLTPEGFTGRYRTPECRAAVVLKAR